MNLNSYYIFGALICESSQYNEDWWNMLVTESQWRAFNQGLVDHEDYATVLRWNYAENLH